MVIILKYFNLIKIESSFFNLLVNFISKIFLSILVSDSVLVGISSNQWRKTQGP